MTKETPRQASVIVSYQRRGKSKTAGGVKKRPPAVVQEYTEGFTYVDPASGESDTVSITFSNVDLRWANQWMPKKSDKLTAKIVVKSWIKEGKKDVFYCGKFCIDDVSYTGPALTCTINGVSVPEGNAFRSTERSKTWKMATLREVAEEIAGKYHLGLLYNADTVKMGTIEQSSESDSSFLKKVCEDCGLAIKIYDGEIVIFDKARYEAMEPMVVLKREDLQDWSYNTTLVGTYTGVCITYTSGKDDKEMKCIIGGGSRILNINEKVENLQEAQIKACARINAENEKAITMNVTIMADIRIVAGTNVRIKGLYHLSGKYFVDKVTHNLGPDEAYTMTLELHKCQKRFMPEDGMQADQEGELTVGDRVIVNGPAYWGGNGGRANQCNNIAMYITEIIGSEYQYQYGVSHRQGGTRYGWCSKDSLRKE